MPTSEPSELGPYEPVSDELVLAAIDRAQRHNPQGYDTGVLRSRLLEHLGFEHTPATSLKLRPQIARLKATGLLASRKVGGYTVWRLTRDGTEQLAIAQRKGRDLVLPESPQHREWRHAQTDAGKRVDNVREGLRLVLAETSKFIDSKPDGESDVCLALRERLASQLQSFATVLYRLNEWPEPNEDNLKTRPTRKPREAVNRATPRS